MLTVLSHWLSPLICLKCKNCELLAFLNHVNFFAEKQLLSIDTIPFQNQTKATHFSLKIANN